MNIKFHEIDLDSNEIREAPEQDSANWWFAVYDKDGLEFVSPEIPEDRYQEFITLGENSVTLLLQPATGFGKRRLRRIARQVQSNRFLATRNFDSLLQEGHLNFGIRPDDIFLYEELRAQCLWRN